MSSNINIDAEKQLLEALRSQHSGAHPDIANALSNLGIAYRQQGKSKEAIEYLQQALEMRQALYQGNHIDVKRSLALLADTYLKFDQLEKALQTMEMMQELHQGNHPDIVNGFHTLGIVYEKLGKAEKSLEYKEKALEMMRELHPGNHPDIANLYTKIGIAYENLGQVKKGLECHEKALTMYQALHQGNHPDIAYSLNNVGLAYEQLGDKTKALELYKQSYVMKCKLWGQDNPSTQLSKNNILYLDPTFSGVNENRTIILVRGVSDKDIITVKDYIQGKVLDQISYLSSKNCWSSGMLLSKPTILGDWGIKGYLSEEYLTTALGELANPKNIKIAQMLCFEAICLGVMRRINKDTTCIEKFATSYPELLKEIIAEHPEYMIDGSIVKLCTDDSDTLAHLLGENFDEAAVAA